jgi:eukaryotic-like serine/threonine-protein kinase
VLSAVTQVSAAQPAVPKVKLVATRRVGKEINLLTMTFPIRVDLVRVPAGEFLMGSDPKVDKDSFSEEQPQHPLYLPDFYIGKYPVTNRQYAAFVKAARQRAPEHWKNSQILAGRGNHPVVDVFWQDAVAFCQWLSQASGNPLRLPMEA